MEEYSTNLPLILRSEIEKSLEEANVEILALVLEKRFIRENQSDLRKQLGVNEDWHKHHCIDGPSARGCGCAYCTLWHRYVSTKVSAHRLRRKIDDDYMYNPYDNPASVKHLHELEKEWPELRQQKRKLAVELGL
jgi:hypothetical protein